MNSFFLKLFFEIYLGCSVDNPRKKRLPKSRQKFIKVTSYEKSIEFFKKNCFKTVYMDTYNAVFTCSMMSKKFRQKADKVLLHVRGWWNFFFRNHAFPQIFQMDTENVDFSSLPEFFGKKSFARHPKVINKCFFLKKSFRTMSLWTRGRQFRNNPMNNFCRKAKEILLNVQ